MSDQAGPWHTLSKKEVYDNAWISVEHHEVITPGALPGIYGKIHFKNYAIGIIPLDSNLNTWIVGQYRYTLKEYSWEIPMGGGPLDRDILESAQRELKEETGITATSWEKLMTIHTSNSVTDECGYVFIARDLHFDKPEFDPTEKIEIRKLQFEEVYKMVMSGEITDSISVAAILKLKHHLN